MRSRRRRLGLALILVVVLVAGTLYALPELMRYVAVAQIHAITGRPVRIDAVDFNPFKGQLTVRGFRVDDDAQGAALAEFERLDVQVRLGSLLRGHLWIREAVLKNSTVRIVRFPEGLNVADLIKTSGTTSHALDVTVDRFALVGGTVTLEDRALPEPKTWTSDNIQIEARNVSTRRDDGTAVGSSVTAGAPVSIQLEQLRLYPVHLQGTVTVTGLDLSMAQLYLPPDSTVAIDRGRASSSLRVTLDARAGVRADLTSELEDVALVTPGSREPLAMVPKLTTQLTDLAYQDGRLAIGRFELAGAGSVADPSTPGGPRFKVSTVRVSVGDLTWPVSTAGRLEAEATVAGRGKLALTGALRPPPAASQLRVRIADLQLAPWARFLPVSARITGVAEADLRVNESLAAGVPARLQGSIAVNDLGVRDAREKLIGARRIEATGLEVHWPAGLVVKRLVLTGPQGLVERDRSGNFPLMTLWNRPAAMTPANGAARAPASTTSSSVNLTIAELVVRDGAVAWRDQTVMPAVGLDFSRVDASVTGVGWPLHGALGVRGGVRPPGGGRLEVQGRVSVEPVTADLRVTARDADVAPYHAYIPTTARINGWTDFDLTVRLPLPAEEDGMMVRGTAGLSRVDVRDGQRTVMRLERGVATGLEFLWPDRVVIRELALKRPWLLFERDDKGALALRTLLPGGASSASAAAGPAAGASAGEGNRAVTVALRRLVIEDGGARVVDRSLSPPFAVDLGRLVLRAEGLATAPAKPARVELTGRLGPGSELNLRGTIGPFGGPLQLDVTGDLRGFWVPRTDSYLLHYSGWEARAGWLTTNLRCRIDRDALDARTDIRLSRLEVARAARDEAQARMGLPLGLIVALMKDSRGDINISLPVGGRLSDPRFDFSEAIWSTVRNAAVKAITAPVSWIGRVHVGSDSRIERIQVDPVRFRPGTSTLTAEGYAQASRLGEFLQKTPEVRMALTPSVSSRDLVELRRRALESEVAGIAHERRVSPEVAATQLFDQRFPGRTPPATTDAVLSALAETGPVPAAAVTELAAQRVETVRATAKKAGADPGRLVPDKLVQGEDAVESQVALELAEPDSAGGRAGPRLPEFLRRLGAGRTESEPARK
jgi:Domain of Unknown Function (DUF748)